jgi:hypothetical protein
MAISIIYELAALFCVARQIATNQNKTANYGLGSADCDRLLQLSSEAKLRQAEIG